MREVHVSARSTQPFEALLGADRMRSVQALANVVRTALGGRCVWNVNSTDKGGGVAEMLHSLVRYARGFKVDVRWLVLDASPEFFRITKRVHNALHGSIGDGSPLGAEQVEIFRRESQENAAAIQTLVRPADIVICHDPQSAGLVPLLLHRGAAVVWRCHIGHEELDNEEVNRGWEFLRPFLASVPIAIFSRAEYSPSWLPEKRTLVVPPNIDPFSAKNREMDEAAIRAILVHVGLVEGPAGSGDSTFIKEDGSIGRVDRRADVVRMGGAPSWETPLVVQVSRWDTMKDPIGVLQGFASLVDPEAPRGAALVLAGPSVNGVADDPEAAKVFGEVQQAYLALPAERRAQVHLALLPMDDAEENGAIVNALQRHASVIVQKSLVEGFGLTVTEALWKSRPVIASAVGGIVDQIRDGVDGLLVHDPRDLTEFGNSVRRVLEDEGLARRLGQAGHERVRDNYLSITALEKWAELLLPLLQSELSRTGTGH